MPHPGVAMMVAIGVGLGAFLYYMFADNQHQYSNDSGDYNMPLPGPSDSWTINQNENKPRRRKRSSGATGKTSCTICLAELGDKVSWGPEFRNAANVQLFPCMHKFHKACIDKWQEQGPSETHNTCPNCREDILGTTVGNLR